MSWKTILILAAGAILLSSTVFAQTHGDNTTKNQRLNGGGLSSGEYYPSYTFRGSYTASVTSERRAAERGDASAQFKLALRYDSDQKDGVPQDHAEAVKWLRKAAEQDFVKAQYNLGGMYNSGQGVPQDHAAAAKWYRKAAEQGFASAQKNLGAQYGQGQGVPQSDAEAFIWSSIAAISGDEGAVNNRDFAASKLSSEDLDAAQERAAKLYAEIQQRTEGG
jgi:TPR repeat protein